MILYYLMMPSREKDAKLLTNKQPVPVTGQTFFSAVTKPGETSRTVAPPPQATPCPVCEGNHSAVKYHKIVNTLPPAPLRDTTSCLKVYVLDVQN